MMERMIKYPHLFSPIVLAKTLFRNRIFASPTGWRNEAPDGVFSDRATAYYERKAKGGAASVATCQVMVDSEYGMGMLSQFCADTPLIYISLSRIAQGIRSYGAVPSLELQHMGMYANRELAMYGGKSSGVSYGPVEFEMPDRIARPMTEELIGRTIEKYASAAALAKKCGYGMITVHGGHGWLLHQFMSPIINTRKDKWGGSDIENRMRLPIEVCKAIRKVVGPGFPIEFRISGSECYDGGYDIETGVEIARHLDEYVDLIHVSAGNHEVDEVFTVTHPSMFLPEAPLVPFAAEIKKHVSTPVATIGGLSDPELMEEIIASGKADVVEMGRGFFADQDFALKARTGDDAHLRKCLRCFACFSSLMFTGMTHCSINPELGYEVEVRIPAPLHSSKRVLVIGGGVAGMQAALTAAQLGHDVSLCEQRERLGGVLCCEESVSFKKNLDFYLNQQARLIEEAGVRIDLNTTADENYVRRVSPDVIIAALGSKPAKPPIPGIEREGVMSAQEAYGRLDTLGKRVMIVGAGLVGVELALHLTEHGRHVTILEAMDKIADGGNILHMSALRVAIKKSGLDIRYNVLVRSIDGKRMFFSQGEEDGFLEADNIVYATGQRPLREEAMKFNFLAPEFYMIGDCVASRNMMSSINEAYFTARNLR
jgi:2,4-dienoyl-CoA reductase-like NADH-dependent reductase (Old Yellow Enzyme family)/thioredoxin reductase